jgi:hypothetical protein
LGERFRFFGGLMSFRDLLSVAAAPDAAHAESSPRSPRQSAADDLRGAVDFLRDTAPWSESWAVQRFGLLGSTQPLVAQWFIRATILDALFDVGCDVRVEAKALLDEIPPGELRYYGPCRDIPPDADDLAIMLELAAKVPAAALHVETWIELMLLNVEADRVIPTWFYRGALGPTTVGAQWNGNDCNAVRLKLLAALLSFDAARFDGLIHANARRVLAAARAGVIEGFYHYDASFTSLVFLRFAERYRCKAFHRPLAREIAAVEAAIRARDARAQRLDGGWGSPQRTAVALEGAAMSASTDPLLLDRALRYLGEHQLADGSWPAEPLYRSPARGGRVGHHRGRALTTALCARSLAAVCARSQHGEGGRG